MSISKWWPLYDLVIRTPRLELRLPREEELPALAVVAAVAFARLGVLTLAFDHLGAECAVSEAFLDNAASLGVSRRLGLFGVL